MNPSVLHRDAMYKTAADASPFKESSPATLITRGLIVVPFSLLVTLGLLLGMHALIKNDKDYIEPPTETPEIVDFVMEKVPPIKNDYAKPVRPEPVVEPPKAQREFQSVISNDGSTGVTFERMNPPIPPVIDNHFGSDQLMPLIKVQPDYPAIAAARGIEGFVDVVFDVTATGTTENIRIIHAEPSSVFNRSVIQALQRWKYKPKLVNDNPVKALDVRERITFEFQ